MGKILCLFKTFSKKEYAEEFLSGKLRFGKLGYYKNIEDIRNDSKEGLVASYSPTKSILSIAGIEVSQDEIVGKIEYSKSYLEEEYIHCFSSIKTDDVKLTYPLVERFSQFGDYMVVIKNVPKFLKKFQIEGFTTLNKEVKLLEASSIYYKDLDNDHIPLGTIPEGFLKDISYKEECEYRIKLTTQDLKEEFHYIDIGSLNDIADLIHINDFSFEIKCKESGRVIEKIY